MSDDSVQVKFGAQIDGLVAGINDVKAQLGSLTAPVAAIGDAFKGFAELGVVAFATDKLSAYVNHITDLGEQIERASAMTGLGAGEFQALAEAMRLTGGSAEGIAPMVDRLEKNIQAAREGTGKAREEFARLGISLNDLNKDSVYQIILKMADGMTYLSDSTERAAIAQELGSRGFAQMLPALVNGSAAIEGYQAKLKELSDFLNDAQVESFAKTHQSLKLLGDAFEGLGIQTVRVIQPMIDVFVGGFTKIISVINQALSALADLRVMLSELLLIAIADMVKAFEEAAINIELAATKVKLGWQAVGDIIADIAHGRVKDASGEWSKAVAQMDAASVTAKTQIGDLEKQYQSLAGSINNAALSLTDFAGKTKPGEAGGAGGAGAGATDNTLALDDIKTDAEIAKLKLQLQKDTLDQEVALGKLSKAQELADLQDLLGQEYDAELAALEQKKALYAEGTTEYEGALNAEDVLLQKYLVDYQKINDQIALANDEQIKKTQAEYKSFFDTIDKSLDQMLAGVLQGTQTWQQAMAKVFDNLALSFIEDVTKMLLKATALQALNLTGNGGGLLAQSLAGGLPQAVGGTQSNASNPLTAAITALTTALGLSTTATTTSSAISQGMEAAQQVVGTATTALGTATVANTVATIANTGAEGGSSGLGAMAGIAAIASLDVGAWSIPQNGLAFLHAGEMVIPADSAQTFRAGATNFGSSTAAGPAGTFTINLNAIDTQSGAQFLKQNAAVIAQTIATQVRNGNSSLTNAARA